MYDIYFMGTFVKQIPADSFYLYTTRLADMYKGSHWERNWNAPVSEAYILAGDKDGKILYRFIKV